MPQSPGLQLLIAEDSTIVRERLVNLARQHLPANSICSVATGKDAVAVFDHSSPDAVLLDLGLPDMTGLEVLEHIRRRGTETEVVVFTNWGGPEMATRCHLLGANHFVSKAHDIGPVIEILRTITASKSAAPAPPLATVSSAALPQNARGGDRVIGTNPVSALLVEDDDSQANLLVKLLPRRLPLGSSISRAGSLAEALECVRDGRFEVVLVDLGLPDCEGAEAVVALRLASPAAAIIVLSAHQDDATIELAMQGGADDYFIKGELTADGIARAIISAAKRQRSARALTIALESRRRIMDSSVDVICTLDAAGRFVEVGTACERLWGFAREELIGRISTDWIAAADRSKSDEFLESVRRGATTHEFENQFVCKDGSAVDMMWSAVWSGDDRLMYCVAHDITTRKRNEETLRATVESALDCIITIDETNTVLEFNPAAEQTFGWTRAEALGRQFSDLIIPPEFRAGHARGMAKLLDPSQSQLLGKRVEIRAMHANGTEFPAELSLVRLGTGRPARFTAFVRGITERVSARQKLEAQEEQYRVLFESNPNAMWVYDLDDLRILAINDAAVAQYGYSHEEFLKLNLFALRPAEDREPVKAAISREGAAPRHAGTWRHLRKDGSLMLIDVYSSPTTFEGKPARMAVLLNVTEQKRAEELLRESERAHRASAAQLETERARLVAAQAVGKLGSWEFDLRTQVEVWSAESYRILELEPTRTATHQLFLEVVHPEDRAGVDAEFLASLTGPSTCAREHRLLLPDGRIKFVHQRWQIFHDEQGQPARAAGTIQDVTERVVAREALQREREFLSALVENVSDGIVSCDADGVITFFNGATRAFYGLPAEPVSADRWAEHFDVYLPDGTTLMPKEQMPLFRALTQGSVHDAEMVIAPRNGTMRRIVASGRSFTNQLGEKIGAVVAMHDVTAAKEAEEKLSRSHQLMEAVTEGTTDAIFAKDAEGRYVMINTAGAAFLGRTPAEVIGCEDSEFFSGEALERIEKRDREIMRTGEMRTDEDLSTVAGIAHTYFSMKGPLRNAAGEIAGVIGYSRDISERKNAEAALRQSEAELRTLVESIPQIVWISRPCGSHLHFNQRWIDYTGLTIEESLGDGWSLPLHPHDRARAVQRWQEAVESGAGYDIEFRLRGPDGSFRWMLGRALPLRDSAGTITKWLGTCTDIEDLKVAAESAQQREQHQRELAAELANERARLLVAQTVAKVGDWQVDFVTDVRTWSAETYRIFEVDLEQRDATHERFMEIVHPDDRAAVKAASAASIDRRTPSTVTHRLLMPDGRIKFVEQHWQVVHDEDGRPLHSTGTVQDITEATRTLQRLSDAQRIGQIGDWEWDVGTQAITWSPQVFTILGRDPNLGPPQDYKEYAGFYDVENASLLDASVTLAIKSGEPQEHELAIVRCDGQRIHIHGLVVPRKDETGQVIGLSGTVQDITARKRTEAAASRLLSVLEASLNEIYIFDADTLHFEYVNECALRNLGHSMETMRAQTPLDLKPEFTADQFHKMIAPLRRQEKPKVVFETVHRRADATLYPVEVHLQLVRRGENDVFLAIINDITARKQAERTLVEQAEMLNLAHDAIVVRGSEDRVITFWNTGAEHLYGWTATEAIGRRVDELIYDDPEQYLTVAHSLALSGEFRGEVHQVAKDGRRLVVSARANVVPGSGDRPGSVLVIQSDITEHRKLENQFLRAQRLESIGTLASGVAHDLNNVLAPILMSAPLLREEEITSALKHKIIDTIEASAERGAQIVKQVLTFARGVEGDRVLVDPRHLIKEMAEIAQQTFPKMIAITTRYAEGLDLIEGDPTQLHQVLLNLAVNARDAMPTGGKLLISAENLEVDEHYAAMTPDTKPGPHVLIVVSDTGTGIPPHVMDKMFDPFFTTKEIGKGSGLGLSTVLGIVKSHGGGVNAYSSPQGTTFRIHLPAAAGQQLEVRETQSELPRGQGETILLVDDEPAICEVAEVLLGKSGYKVLVADDGPAALAIFAQRQGEISVVITDLLMPIMNGLSLARIIRKMNPLARIVLSSGREDDCAPAELNAIGVAASLTKPYTQATLLRTLHQLLHDDRRSLS